MKIWGLWEDSGQLSTTNQSLDSFFFSSLEQLLVENRRTTPWIFWYLNYIFLTYTWADHLTSLHLPIISSVAAPLHFWITRFSLGAHYFLHTRVLCLGQSRDLVPAFSYVTSDMDNSGQEFSLLLPYLPIKSWFLLFID